MHQVHLDKHNPVTTSKLEVLNPWSEVNMRYQRKDLSVYDSHTMEIGAKGVLKYCSIGNAVKIGSKSKLNNCVAMDGVTVGEK